jgi:pilus assembly protein Flp/PilA
MSLMRRIASIVKFLVRDRRAATAVEYGFLLALIVLAIMAALVSLGEVSTGIWSNVSEKVRATH